MNKTIRPLLIALLITSICVGSLLAQFPVQAVYGDCVAYDSFTRGDGSLGNSETAGPSAESCPALTWTGSTYAIVSGKAGDTPTTGSEALTDAGLENWTSATDLTSWAETISGSSTVNREAVTIHGGTYALRMDIDSGPFNAQIYQDPSLTGKWYQYSFWGKSFPATRDIQMIKNGAGTGVNISLTGLYAQYISSYRFTAGGVGLKRGSNSPSTSLFADDLSVVPLTLSSLVASVPTSTADNFLVEAEVTLTTATQAGVVVSLDSAASPANFVIAYHDGVNIFMDKVVAGTYTNLITTAVTYSAGAKVKVTKNGNTYRLYYNGTQRGADQTISDAGIVSNTIHGLFSTYIGNSFDNFYIMDFSATATPTSTSTSTNTSTSTSTSTSTNTPTDTPTSTSTSTSTDTPTSTSTDTLTPTPTDTPTSTSTSTSTSTVTNTPDPCALTGTLTSDDWVNTIGASTDLCTDNDVYMVWHEPDETTETSVEAAFVSAAATDYNVVYNGHFTGGENVTLDCFDGVGWVNLGVVHAGLTEDEDIDVTLPTACNDGTPLLRFYHADAGDVADLLYVDQLVLQSKSLGIASWDSTITYGDTANLTVSSAILLVVILAFLAWLVTTYMQRRRKG